MMRRFILMAILALGVSFGMDAQNRGKAVPSMEVVAQRQCRHIVSTLGLSGDVANEFAELYSAYKREMLSVKDRFPMVRKGDCKDGCLSDEQIEQNILNRFAQGRALLDIRESYYKKFRKILTPAQIQAMYGAERCQAEGFRQHHADRCDDHGRRPHHVDRCDDRAVRQHQHLCQ